MSKESTMSVVTTEESPTFKRQRMLEVRHAVAKAVKNNERVDLMGFTGSDIARSQIALQDLLTKEQDKHQRAQGHIINLKAESQVLVDIMQVQSMYVNMMANEGLQENDDLSEKVQNAELIIKTLQRENMNLLHRQDETNKEIAGLKLALQSALKG